MLHAVNNKLKELFDVNPDYSCREFSKRQDNLQTVLSGIDLEIPWLMHPMDSSRQACDLP